MAKLKLKKETKSKDRLLVNVPSSHGCQQIVYNECLYKMTRGASLWIRNSNKNLFRSNRSLGPAEGKCKYPQAGVANLLSLDGS